MKSPSPMLIVEDNIIDLMNIQRAIKQLKIVNDLVIKSNGVEALEYLRGASSEIPCLIFLDLNMPKMNGIEFLRHIRQDERLKNIPVIILSSSTDNSDRIETFSLGIVGYLIKPVDYFELDEVVNRVDYNMTLSGSTYDEVAL